jgi:hypothetical protein
MRKKLVLVTLLALALAAAAGAYTLADTIGGDDGDSTYGAIIDKLPPGGSCICPMIWAPVVCARENPDGSVSRQAFSNGCVAGCYGYTDCARIVVLGP